MSDHTLQEQLRELAGARQLATSAFLRSTDPETKQRARVLLADIRRERRQLRAQVRGQAHGVS